MSALSEAFYEAVSAVAAHTPERPLPPLSTLETDWWKLTLNGSRGPIDRDGTVIPPFSVLAEHKEYFVIALLDPAGGCIGGGMTEGEFIEQMKAIEATGAHRDAQPSEQSS